MERWTTPETRRGRWTTLLGVDTKNKKKKRNVRGYFAPFKTRKKVRNTKRLVEEAWLGVG
jgi:hypothetical protein